MTTLSQTPRPLLAWTWDLRHPSRALQALKHVPPPHRAVWEGLSDLVLEDHSSKLTTDALFAMTPGAKEAIVRETCLHVLTTTPHILARHAALTLLKTSLNPEELLFLAQRLEVEPSWTLRREILRIFRDQSMASSCLPALLDPHWRTRQEALLILESEGQSNLKLRQQVQTFHQSQPGQSAILDGACQWLHWRWELQGEARRAPTGDIVPDAIPEASWWSPDPACLRQNLKALSTQELREALPDLPAILASDNSGARAVAVLALQTLGAVKHLRPVLDFLDDPRRPHAYLEAHKILKNLDQDRRTRLARFVLDEMGGGESCKPCVEAWAKEQMNPGELAEPVLRCLGHHGRAAALTVERAEVLWDEPTLESSWTVLEAAARLLRRSPRGIRKGLGDPPPHVARVSEVVEDDWRPGPSCSAPLRALGATGLEVSALGISGHYGLERRGFARAVEAGVNLFFWEPSYHQQTTFWRRDLSAARRAEQVLVCGSFEAEPARIRRDMEYALKSLKVESLGLFLIFWVRDEARISPEVHEMLLQAQREGLIRSFGMSTHQRALALQAIDAGWPAMMVRHSAAHQGAEKELLPAMVARGLSAIAFNALCYSRLLSDPRRMDVVLPTPVECYRYCLSQPGIISCMSAPADMDQLEQNLSVLHADVLTEAELVAIRHHGEVVYAENSTFARCVRWRQVH